MKVTSLSVLLCLISGLVKFHSQSVPYISFNTVPLPNNSYVNATALWQNSGASIQCHTDLEGQSHGDWYYPSGHRVSLPRSNFTAPLFQKHEYKVIRLFRRSNRFNTSGIYSCDTETNAVNNNSRETVYTGLYFTGGNVVIPQSIQFTVESNLDGDSPQFTLTCTSTSGPATTVSWTKDSEEVVGGLTVLDNAETAEYVHTLTVTGRLPGEYKCFVSNNKPSADEKSFIVKVASAPTNLMAVQEGPTGIRVSWTPPSPLGDTIGYRILYSGGSSGSVDVSGRSTNDHLLTDLVNGASYTISIIGTSEHFSNEHVELQKTIALSNPSSSTKDCDGTGKVGASIVGGFVGGALITAVLAIVIHLLLIKRMRERQKGQIVISTNQAYGHVTREEVNTEYAIPDTISGVAMDTEDSSTYETVPT